MQKNKNILSIILILLISACNFIYADPPNWDENGDGVLDNFNDYENNGSITASVFSNDINVGDDGDMIAAFVNGEQRGVGLATLTPFGPYIDTYQFQIMIYSNATNGENITFQFYDQSDDIIYYINESLEFTVNMIEGNVFTPFLLTFNNNLDNNDPPVWDENGDGVLDNFNDYENNGSITASVFSNDINVGDDGDMIAAFVNGEQRGVGLATLTPFGPYIDTYQFQIMIYSNATNGENITFQFYDSSQNQVYFLDQTLEFTTNMIVGDVFNPYLFTFTIDNTDDILGCTDPFACNYSPEATVNDGSCEYPENNYNCAGDCIVEIDCEGNCGGGSIEDPCGICNGNGSTCAGCIDNLACNYDSNAILDDGSCEYPEENFDCDGNCIAEIDCEGNCGGSAIIDECGECNGPGIIDGFCDCNENILDCNNNCGGEAYIDNCGDCVGGDTNNLECESFSYEIPLHIGSNLISFHALPVDNSVENILIEDSNDFIYSIISETNSAINTGETWIGSLNEMNNIDGYWFQNINSMN